MSLLPTYVQVGTTAAVDVISRFKLYFKSGALINVPEPKNIYTHEWADLPFDEVYIPDMVTFKAYDIELKFNYIGKRDSYNAALRDFINYIGVNEFSLFDDWQKTGLRLRYKSYKETDKYRKDRDIWQVAITFRVDKPLSYGQKFNSAATFGGKFLQACTLYFSDGTQKSATAGKTYTKSMAANSFVIIVPTKLGNIL